MAHSPISSPCSPVFSTQHLGCTYSRPGIVDQVRILPRFNGFASCSKAKSSCCSSSSLRIGRLAPSHNAMPCSHAFPCVQFPRWLYVHARVWTLSSILACCPAQPCRPVTLSHLNITHSGAGLFLAVPFGYALVTAGPAERGQKRSRPAYPNVTDHHRTTSPRLCRQQICSSPHHN